MHSALSTPPYARTIDDTLVDLIADAADTDRRSVIRRLAGLPVKGRPGARIDRAIRDHLPTAAAQR